MSKGGQIPFEGKTASEPFLISKSDFPSRQDRKTTDASFNLSFLKNVLSNANIEEPFIEHALNRMAGVQKFGVLMIRLDPAQNEEGVSIEDPEGLVKDLGEVITLLCQDEDSGWGLYEPSVLCCFFAEKSDTECMEIGGIIQKQLAEHHRETVSMGCSRYPMVHFSKRQAFQNARKAIDHGAFFGPGSRVSFDAVSLNISGDDRYQEGDISGAICEYRAALRIDPANVNVLNSKGVCHAVKGDWEQAVHCFETALWIEPGEIMALYNLALAYQVRGERDKALKRYLEILDLQKDHFETLFQIGRLYVEEKQPEKGEPYIREAVSLRPGSGPANRYLGEYCLMTGKNEEAIIAFKRAIKINPNDAASLSALGYLFNEIGENPEVALTFCEQSVKIEPDDGLFRYRLGLLYYHQDRIPDAEKAFSEAIGLGYDAKGLLEKIQQTRQDNNL